MLAPPNPTGTEPDNQIKPGTGNQPNLDKEASNPLLSINTSKAELGNSPNSSANQSIAGLRNQSSGPPPTMEGKGADMINIMGEKGVYETKIKDEKGTNKMLTIESSIPEGKGANKTNITNGKGADRTNFLEVKVAEKSKFPVEIVADTTNNHGRKEADKPNVPGGKEAHKPYISAGKEADKAIIPEEKGADKAIIPEGKVGDKPNIRRMGSANGLPPGERAGSYILLTTILPAEKAAPSTTPTVTMVSTNQISNFGGKTHVPAAESTPSQSHQAGPPPGIWIAIPEGHVGEPGAGGGDDDELVGDIHVTNSTSIRIDPTNRETITRHESRTVFSRPNNRIQSPADQHESIEVSEVVVYEPDPAAAAGQNSSPSPIGGHPPAYWSTLAAENGGRGVNATNGANFPSSTNTLSAQQLMLANILQLVVSDKPLANAPLKAAANSSAASPPLHVGKAFIEEAEIGAGQTDYLQGIIVAEEPAAMKYPLSIKEEFWYPLGEQTGGPGQGRSQVAARSGEQTSRPGRGGSEQAGRNSGEQTGGPGRGRSKKAGRSGEQTGGPGRVRSEKAGRPGKQNDRPLRGETTEETEMKSENPPGMDIISSFSISKAAKTAFTELLLEFEGLSYSFNIKLLNGQS